MAIEIRTANGSHTEQRRSVGKGCASRAPIRLHELGFFMLITMTFINVIAGFVITIVAARRDFGVQ